MFFTLLLRELYLSCTLFFMNYPVYRLELEWILKCATLEVCSWNVTMKTIMPLPLCVLTKHKSTHLEYFTQPWFKLSLVRFFRRGIPNLQDMQKSFPFLNSFGIAISFFTLKQYNMCIVMFKGFHLTTRINAVRETSGCNFPPLITVRNVSGYIAFE